MAISSSVASRFFSAEPISLTAGGVSNFPVKSDFCQNVKSDFQSSPSKTSVRGDDIKQIVFKILFTTNRNICQDNML
jgi:hypothetical protein